MALIKEKDPHARPAADYDIIEAEPNSVISATSVGKPKPRAKHKETKLPEQLTPQLATLVDRTSEGDWHYEIKFDGYRMLARIRDGEVRLFTRNGHDWSDRLPRQTKALQALKLKDSWLDGEVVSLNRDGLPDFQALQNAFDIGRSLDIVYYLFDAPFLNGRYRCRSAVRN